MDRLLRRAHLLIVIAVALLAAACGHGGTTVVSNARLTPVPEVEVADDDADTGPAAGEEGESGAPEEDDPGDGVEPSSDDLTPEELAEAGDGFQLAPLGANDDGGEAESGEAAVSGAFLAQVAEATEQSESYRYEVFFSLLIADSTFEIDVAPSSPLAIGAVAGSNQTMSMDLGPVLQEMFAAMGGGGTDSSALLRDLFGDDLTMETIIVDRDTMYVRAPFLAGMVDGPAAGELPPELAAWSELRDRWGVVDVASLAGFEATDLAALAGGQGGSSPDQVLAMLRQAAAEVDVVGRTDIRGVSTTHLRASVDIATMLDTQGVDPAAMGLEVGAFDFDLPIDVFVDDGNRVRRVAMTMSLELLEAVAPDEEIPSDAEFEITTTIDLFDFGADLEIAPPPAGDIAGDFTDLFASLADLGL